MKKIGICFIGCGNHANRFVYPALSGLPDAALLLENLEENDDVQNVYHNWENMPVEEEE